MTSTQIAYLIIGIIFILLSMPLGYLTYKYFSNRYTQNLTEKLKWYQRFWYNSRHMFLLLFTFIFILTGITFIAMVFGFQPAEPDLSFMMVGIELGTVK